MAKKYIDAVRLCAKIEELEGLEYPCDNSEQNVGFGNALDRVSDIIASLQQEQPSEDLEKEIDKTFSECTDGYNFDWDRLALHFYELGKQSKK